jgi:hypothetical protein
MVGVSLGEGADLVRAWGERLNIPFPLWLDPFRDSPTAFGVRGHPATVLIDRAGRLVARVPGEREWSGPPARTLVAWLLAQASA